MEDDNVSKAKLLKFLNSIKPAEGKDKNDEHLQGRKSAIEDIIAHIKEGNFDTTTEDTFMERIETFVKTEFPDIDFAEDINISWNRD